MMDTRRFAYAAPLIVFLTIFGCGGGGGGNTGINNNGGNGGNDNAVLSVTIQPSDTTVNAGGSKQFTATVAGDSTNSVTWSLRGDGTITQNGLYTSAGVQGFDEVIATSVSDPSKSDMATVKIIVPK